MAFSDDMDTREESILRSGADDSTTWTSALPSLEEPESWQQHGKSDFADACNMDWLVEHFEPIGLKQLNAKAHMLKRLDNKYVVRRADLHDALEDLIAQFDVLEIDGKRVFTYETCYFDDAKNSSYFDHLRGRRQRFKVRVRKYTDAQMCFVEMKLKDKRGVTVKKRLDYLVEKYGTLDSNAWNHIISSYKELYGRDFAYQLAPVLEMCYKRVTLVAKDGGELMTIDCQLSFSGHGRSCSIDDHIFIVETKSSNGNGIADKILRELHQHPVKSCSKYCVAMAALKGVARHNRFLPALRKLNVIARATAPTLASASASTRFRSNSHVGTHPV